MVFGRRLGRTFPIVLGFLSIVLVSFSAAVAAPPALIYIGAQIYSFAWVFLNPYISGAVAALGADGMIRGPLICPESIRFFNSSTGSAAPPPDSSVV